MVANGSQEQEEQEEEQEAANRWAMPIANSHPWRHSGHWVMPIPILGNGNANCNRALVIVGNSKLASLCRTIMCNSGQKWATVGNSGQ